MNIGVDTSNVFVAAGFNSMGIQLGLGMRLYFSINIYILIIY